MSATRPLIALALVIGLALTASAQTRLINPMERSFYPSPHQVVPVSALQDEAGPVVGEADIPPPPAIGNNVPQPPATEADVPPPPAPEPEPPAAEVDVPQPPATEPDVPPPPATEPDVAQPPAAEADVPAPPASEAGDVENGARSASDLDLPPEPEEPPPANGSDAPSASDVPAPMIVDDNELPLPDKFLADETPGCNSACCGCGGRAGGLFSGCSSEPWHLPQPRVLKNLGIKVGGWIEQGITTNNNNPTDNFNSTVLAGDRDGEWQVNQMWLYVTKPIDQQDCCWQIGGQVDIVYGTDWRYGRFFGLEERINNDNQFYGWVFPQMYAEVGGHNLSVKMGHMAGPLGYEIVPAVANFFYSHSIAMSYFEPQLVTGVWADYKLGDQWTIQAGFHRGWFMFEDLDQDLDFMGGIQWTSCDKRTSLRYALTLGDNEGLYGQTWFASSLVLQHKFNDKLRYVLQHDLGSITDIALPGTAVFDEQWYGLNQYLFYKINKKLEAGLRVEWMRDDDGGKLAGVGNTPPGTIRGWTGGPGYAGNFWEVSMGLNWSPHPNVKFRPELRYDWYDGNPSPFPGGALPFDDGLGNDQLTAAVDLLLTF